MAMYFKEFSPAWVSILKGTTERKLHYRPLCRNDVESDSGEHNRRMLQSRSYRRDALDNVTEAIRTHVSGSMHL